jgi:oxygen-independent coproporphyrinogen-3 oxidase
MSISLVQKYNVPGPRYTSYPTVPYWDENSFTLTGWKETFLRSFQESNSSEGISLYIHLPFCESLCTFCGCHKRITSRHEVEHPYIVALLKEWQLYCELFIEKPIIKEIHLGGGTPTFFSAENLEKLKTLFDKIIDMYEIVFLITHNDLVKDWSSKIITVVKTNNISSVKIS